MVPMFKYNFAGFPMSVVLLSHNRLDELIRNIPELIDNCARFGYELIIVDNASDKNICSYLTRITSSKPNVVLMLNESNLGIAGGRNSAFALAQGEFVLSIDDDTRVSSEVLRDLPGLMRGKYLEVGILALRIKHPFTGEEQNFAGDYDTPVRNHHGAACVIRREVLARIGGIDDFCDFGFEELDICIRAHAAGFQILYTPELVVYHNSYLRPGGVGFERRRKRIFNCSRTMCKYFPFWMAQKLSARYFVQAIRGFILNKEISNLFRLFLDHLRGCYLGLRHRTLMPPATVAYYSDPNLVPENGNQPYFGPLIKRKLFQTHRSDQFKKRNP